MSNSVYPSLPGAAVTVTRTPLWKTMKLETTSGREYRGSFMVYPRYRYTLAYEFLRQTLVLPAAAARSEFSQMLGFFNLMKGGYDTFLFSDPDDYTVTDMNFGTGNGSTTAFQLFRTFGSMVEPIFDLNGAPTIKVDGVAKSTPGDYSVSSTGVVTFTSAPANGKALTWSGSYYWRCSFEDDEMDFEKFMAQVWQVQKISFKTVRP